MSLFNYSRPRDDAGPNQQRDSERDGDSPSFSRRPRFRASHKAYVKTMFFSTEHAEVRPLAGNFSRGFLRWSSGGKSFRMLKVGDGDRNPVEGPEEEQYVSKGVAYFRAQFDVTLLSADFEEDPVNVFIGYKLYAPENCIHKAAFIPGGLHRFYLEHHYHMDGWMRRAGFAFVKDGEEISLFNHHPDTDPAFYVLRNDGGEITVQKQ
ncbi:MAG: hypothetical protein MK080_13330 [Opitutales bacterium]|nr:hypothetical protein [Opitutales bacterium]NRA28017.1 hypothetical protein [Opitutales bacterium]